ncbi:FUSC family protein [Camelliibacillus cellulosilyticus]|uniref:FUSC family protein n=1 Tax=Camelliibacillus cellulosilyticus TaxID=2174486 RepID=A0ABV9GRR2_9BACL
MKVRKNWKTIQYWLIRLSASDPGLTRFHRAAKTVLSVMIAVGMMALLIRFSQNVPVTVLMFTGVLAMLSNVTVNDDTETEKRVTTLLLPLSSAAALTASSLLLLVGPIFVDGLLLVVVFLTLSLQRFGNRFFSLGMVGFMSIYFTALLHMKIDQLGWLYIAILVATGTAFIVKFVIWKERPERTLQRSMVSYHILINYTLELIIEMIEDLHVNQARIKKLNGNIIKLNEYARLISEQFDHADPSLIWPGLKSRQLRFYLFDAMMLVEMLASVVKRLKMLRALENQDVREWLLKMMRILRSINVLRGDIQSADLYEAKKTAETFRRRITRLKAEDKDLEDWLYLLRRVKSIAHHVIKGAETIQRVRFQSLAVADDQEDRESRPVADDESDDVGIHKGMSPETQKGWQAVLAGVAAIVLGHFLSPAHQYWMLLAAFVVLFGTKSVGRTVVRATHRFLGTLFGAIVGFGVDQLITGKPIFEIPLLFFCVFMGFYLLKISYAWLTFWITMMLAIMYNLLLGGVNEQVLAARVLDTFIGAGLGALASALLFPNRTKDKVTEAIEEYFNALKDHVDLYLRRFTGDDTEGNLAHHALILNDKFQQIKDEADPLAKRPGYFKRGGLDYQLTVLTAINYYAKQLVAATERPKLRDLDERIKQAIDRSSALFSENIAVLCRLLHENGYKPVAVWSLNREREWIERGPDQWKDKNLQDHLIYDLYYIWKINKAIVAWASDLGAKITHDSNLID